jgi:squalene-hopene/tetraprenyl-beta-curcumene cyclase
LSWKDKTFAIVIICLIIGSLLNVSETTAISSEDSSLLPEEEEVLPYVKLYAGEYGIDPALVMAIISKESRFTSEAKGDIIPPDFRFKDIIEYTAFGYMQVRWPAAYDAGFRGTIVPIEGEIKERYDWFYTYCYSIWTVQPTDEKFFAYLDWPNHGTNPDENIRYGTGYLGWIRDRIVNGIFPNPYNNMLKSTISRYNPRAGDPYVEEVFRYCKKYAVKLGLYRLEEYQNPYDGSWSNSVGVTSLATLAFLNAGYDERDPTVKKAIQYILAHRNPDGSFGKGTYETYETSTAVWALVATHNPDYYDEINAAKDWLIKAQSDEEDGTPPDDPCYGGWRYEISSRDGDLSNAQFALMALDAAYTELGSKLGLQKPDPNDPNGWAFKAIKFISRCQNRPASNDQPWAHDITQPSYNDGGFIYHPRGRSLAGGTKSYGSMTAAGIWSLRLCGVDVTDGRIQEGLKWLAKNEDCSFDDNPGRPYDQPHCFLYYYYLTLAKALTMCFRQKLGEVDWYTALSTKLIDLQCNDGHWVNAPASHGGEDNPDLTTSYAILSLQVRQIPHRN